MKYEHKQSSRINVGDVIIERWMVAEINEGVSGVDVTLERCGAPEIKSRLYYPYREDALVEVPNGRSS